jgi:hypothetical protein
LILRFRELCILKAVLFVAEIPTTKTAAARLAVIAEGAIGTVLAFEEVRGRRTLLAVRAFSTALAMLYREAVGAVFAVDTEVCNVEAVLIVAGVDAHVAVLVVGCVVRVSGVLTPHIHDARTRSCDAEVVELLKKRLLFVKRPPRCQLIPAVGPPD